MEPTEPNKVSKHRGRLFIRIVGFILAFIATLMLWRPWLFEINPFWHIFDENSIGDFIMDAILTILFWALWAATLQKDEDEKILR